MRGGGTVCQNRYGRVKFDSSPHFPYVRAYSDALHLSFRLFCTWGSYSREVLKPTFGSEFRSRVLFRFAVVSDVFARLREKTGARGRASGHGKDEGPGLAAAPHPSHVAHGPLPSRAWRARGQDEREKECLRP